MPKDNFEPLRLIELVRNRPVLWDKTAECYTRKNKYIYWEQIGRELYSTIWDSLTEEQKKFRSFQLSKKWINLRDCYVRNRRESLTNYSLYGIKKRKYQYSSEMSFLDKSWRLKRPNVKIEKDDTGDTVSLSDQTVGPNHHHNNNNNNNIHYINNSYADNSNDNNGYDELQSNNSQFSDNLNPDNHVGMTIAMNGTEISCNNNDGNNIAFDDDDEDEDDDISLHGSHLSNLSQSMIYRDHDDDDQDHDDIDLSHHQQNYRIPNSANNSNNSNPTTTTTTNNNNNNSSSSSMNDIIQNLMVDCIQKFDNPMVSFMLSLRPTYSSFCNKKISIFQRKIMDLLHEVDSLQIDSNHSTMISTLSSVAGTNSSTTTAAAITSSDSTTTNSIHNGVDNSINHNNTSSSSSNNNCHIKRIRNR